MQRKGKKREERKDRRFGGDMRGRREMDKDKNGSTEEYRRDTR